MNPRNLMNLILSVWVVTLSSTALSMDKSDLISLYCRKEGPQIHEDKNNVRYEFSCKNGLVDGRMKVWKLKPCNASNKKYFPAEFCSKPFLKEEVYVSNNLLEGEDKIFRANKPDPGTLRLFKSGLLNGSLVTFWFKAGDIHERHDYADGIRHGKLSAFDSGNRLHSEATYEMGKVTTRSVFLDLDAVPGFESNVKPTFSGVDDDLLDDAKCKSKQSGLVAKRSEIDDQDGLLIFTCSQGKPSGSVQFAVSQKLAVAAEVENGKLNGPYLLAQDGSLVESGSYKEGKLHGMMRGYHLGSLHYEQNYESGNAVGKATYYNKKGQKQIALKQEIAQQPHCHQVSPNACFINAFKRMVLGKLDQGQQNEAVARDWAKKGCKKGHKASCIIAECFEDADSCPFKGKQKVDAANCEKLGGTGLCELVLLASISFPHSSSGSGVEKLAERLCREGALYFCSFAYNVKNKNVALNFVKKGCSATYTNGCLTLASLYARDNKISEAEKVVSGNCTKDPNKCVDEIYLTMMPGVSKNYYTALCNLKVNSACEIVKAVF